MECYFRGQHETFSEVVEMGRVGTHAVAAHQSSDEEVEDAHQDAAVDEQRPPSDTVDQRESNNGGDEEDDVLDRRGDEVDVSGESGHLEDVDDVVHHHVPAEHLLPDLREHADGRASPHRLAEEPHPGHVGGLGSDRLGFADLLVLAGSVRMGGNPCTPHVRTRCDGRGDCLRDHSRVTVVPTGVQASQHVEGLLPAVLGSQPSGGLGEEEQRDEEDAAGDGLQTPRQAEGGRALDERAAVGDEVHDQDAPLDGPLLDPDDAATGVLWRQFGEVDGCLGRRYADAEAVDHTADDEMADVLRAAADHTAHDPDQGCELRRKGVSTGGESQRASEAAQDIPSTPSCARSDRIGNQQPVRQATNRRT